MFLCLHIALVVKYMPVDSNGQVEGVVQYTREEVWVKQGRMRDQLDVGKIYQPEEDGYSLSSVVIGE